jgi:hypothetical protein
MRPSASPDSALPPDARLVLHLGDHKTGSTSIQSALASGQVEVDGVRLCYPMGPFRRNHHNMLARSLRQAARRQTQTLDLADYATEIRAAGADVTILSAEAFEVVDPVVVREALARHLPEFEGRTECVVYLRPHAERLVSSFAEQVKQGIFLGDLTAFHAKALEDGWLSYTPRLRRWRDTFGNARLTVRPMVRGRLKDGDVVADFLASVLPGVAVWLPALPSLNSRASLADLAVLHTLQAAVENVCPRGNGLREPLRILGWRLARMLEKDRTPGPAPALHRALADELVAAYAEDAAAVDAEFLGGEPVLSAALAEAPARAVAEAQSLRLEDHFTPQTVAAIRAWIGLVADLYAHRPADWPAHFKAQPLRTAKD